MPGRFDECPFGFQSPRLVPLLGNHKLLVHSAEVVEVGSVQRTLDLSVDQLAAYLKNGGNTQPNMFVP